MVTQIIKVRALFKQVHLKIPFQVISMDKKYIARHLQRGYMMSIKSKTQGRHALMSARPACDTARAIIKWCTERTRIHFSTSTCQFIFQRQAAYMSDSLRMALLRFVIFAFLAVANCAEWVQLPKLELPSIDLNPTSSSSATKDPSGFANATIDPLYLSGLQSMHQQLRNSIWADKKEPNTMQEKVTYLQLLKNRILRHIGKWKKPITPLFSRLEIKPFK